MSVPSVFFSYHTDRYLHFSSAPTLFLRPYPISSLLRYCFVHSKGFSHLKS